LNSVAYTQITTARDRLTMENPDDPARCASIGLRFSLTLTYSCQYLM
jgi:hypothetical protein